MKQFATALATAATLALTAPATATTIDPVDIISTFGTVSLGDAHITSHTAAAVYVGGNLSGSTSYDGPGVGQVGDISGRFVVAGDISGNITANGGTIVAGSVSGSVNGGGTTVTTGVTIPTGAVTDAFEALSRDLAALPDTAGAALDDADQNLLGLTSGAGENGLAVLNVTDAFLGGGTLTNLVRDAGVTLVVNVSGSDVTINTNVNQDDSNIIFNFFEADTLTVNSTFGFGVLAPFATVNLSGGGTDTFVVGGTINQGTQVRGTFTGDIPQPAPVPLPAGIALMLAGIGAFGALRFARARRA